MVIVNRPIGELTPYEKNAKKHDKRQIANVAESIRQYGFVQPVVIDRDGVIVIGHCRVLAAKKLGMAEVPCVSVEDLTPEQVNALRIVDNKTNESPWDLSMLSVELPELDLSGFEFDFSAVAKKPREELVEDEPPAVDCVSEPVARVGGHLAAGTASSALRGQHISGRSGAAAGLRNCGVCGHGSAV